MQHVYKTIKLIGGAECSILTGTGRSISLSHGTWALREMYVKDSKELDVIPFYMVQHCLIDGKRKDVQYFLDMMYDDYRVIMEALAEVLTILN